MPAPRSADSLPHATRGVRLLGLAITWGILWGAVLGVWAVFPHFLRTNHVHPTSAAQWLLLSALFPGVFAALGAAGSLVTWVVLHSWCILRRRSLRAPGWAYAVAVLVSLPPLYFLLAAGVELTVFRSLVGLEGYRPFVAIAAGSYMLISGLLFLAYRSLARLETPPRPRVLAAGGILALLSGLALAPLWGGAIRVGEVGVPPLSPVSDSSPSSPPLLFVGLDSGSWRVAQPLIDRGTAPTFRHLLETGIRGEVYASWVPVWSGPAWAAIVTGHARQQNGVYQELAAIVPGLPPFQVPLEFDFLLDPLFLVEYRLAARGYIQVAPLPRSVLRRPPFWERLVAAGISVGVIRFPFTFPADGRASVVVSDYAGEDAWKLLEVPARAESGIVSPAEMAPELLASFSGPSLAAETLLSRLMGSRDGPPAHAGSRTSPDDHLRIAAEIDQRTLEVAERLIRARPDLSVVAVFLGGFDTVCHAFWQYRFPEDFRNDPPDEAAVRELGPVIDRGLQRLIATYSEAPNVIVAADHGHGPLYGNRIYSGGHNRRDGIFVAAGPGIQPRSEMLDVTYFDVVPTVLDLLGFAQPEDLPGFSLLAPEATIQSRKSRKSVAGVRSASR
ncbi:MAG: alkaline phosphatase family protein [Candidatus Binatia bacterium]